MTIDLSGAQSGTPERFVPGLMRGEMVEAEHVARYWWATRFAKGRTVLDAGCGLGYGSIALAQAGAERVVGVDIAEPVLDAIAADMPPDVELRVADLRSLPFDAAAFDMVVCFEVIEHVQKPEQILRELRRVASDDALVVVSSPNRDAYMPGNPHHIHEYRPEELRDALAEHFAHTQIVRQYSAAASMILADEQLDATGWEALDAGRLGKLHELSPGAEPYTLVLASDAQLPAIGPAVCLTDPVEIRRWYEHYTSQQEMLHRQAVALRDLETLREQLRRITAELVESENRAARAIDLENTIEELAEERGDLIDDLHRARIAIESITSSVSWRSTAPLRLVKRLVPRRRR